jgi:hypothetical protein
VIRCGRFHPALAEGMEAGAHPRVSAREAYPRRVEHNTLTKGGIETEPRLAHGGELLDPAFLRLNVHLTGGA